MLGGFRNKNVDNISTQSYDIYIFVPFSTNICHSFIIFTECQSNLDVIYQFCCVWNSRIYLDSLSLE